MYLIHEATIKNTDGTIEVTVYIVHDKISRKKYEYTLASQSAAEEFHYLYNRGKGFHGKALTILNKNKIKP